MSHPQPKRPKLGDSADGEATRYESGTRRASKSNVDGFGDEERARDSERPTLPIPRSGGLVGDLDALLRVDRASVRASPKEGSLADLVAKLEPARPSTAAPVFEEAPVGICPTRPSFLLPTALDPEPAADVHDETPGRRFKRTRRHRRMARARWRARIDRSRPRNLLRSRRNVVIAVTVAAVIGFAAILAGIGRSGSSRGASVAPGRASTSQPIPADPAAPPAASEASPSAVEVEPALDASDKSAKPASSSRPASAPAQKGARPPSKRSNDVDFGI
jgi:hypothetical protein